MASTKRLDRRYQEFLARELQRIVDTQFEGNQTSAARAIGVSQAHISHILACKGRGPGLSVLIKLRDFTGRSIDELLGLPPPAPDEINARFRASLDLEVARFRAEAKQEMEQARAMLAEVRAAVAKTPRKRAR